MEEIVFKPKDVKRLFTYGKSICEGKNIYHKRDQLLTINTRDHYISKEHHRHYHIHIV